FEAAASPALCLIGDNSRTRAPNKGYREPPPKFPLQHRRYPDKAMSSYSLHARNTARQSVFSPTVSLWRMRRSRLRLRATASVSATTAHNTWCLAYFLQTLASASVASHRRTHSFVVRNVKPPNSRTAIEGAGRPIPLSDSLSIRQVGSTEQSRANTNREVKRNCTGRAS